MKYDPKNPISKNRAIKRFNQLIEGDDVFSLGKENIRTLSQNRYYQLITTWFAIEHGCTHEEAKEKWFKCVVNPNICVKESVNEFTGEEIKYVRSSAHITTAEMTVCIDRFRTWSSQTANIYLPEAGEYEFLKHIILEEERNKEFL